MDVVRISLFVEVMIVVLSVSSRRLSFLEDYYEVVMEEEQQVYQQ